MTRALITALAAPLTLLAVGCSPFPTGDEPTDPAASALLAVAPPDGASGVGTSPTIEVRFDRPLTSAAAGLIALQRGDCPGPVVAGLWSLDADRTVLRFAPSTPLAPGTRYTIHLGGGMTDATGALVDIETHGPSLGGAWVTRAQVMAMGSMGMGSMSPHAGPGWRHPNGFYGLAFGFTTAGG